jgi:phage terminase large subunit-like protein
MSDDKPMHAFRALLPGILAKCREDIRAIAAKQDWPVLRAYFHHTDKREERAVKAILWGRFFLPHYFTDETPDFHYEMAFDFFGPDNDYEADPRGFAKTTVEQACVMYAVAHSMETFIVLVEKTFTEASEVLSAVRDEFTENPMVLAVYGKMVGKSASGESPDKSKDSEGDMFINGVRLRAKGFNTPIRGLKSKQYRPSLILLDDVEEDVHVRSEEQRRQYLENYTQGIVPAVDIGGRIKVRGTILHNDSLLMNLIRQHDGRIRSAFDPSLDILTDDERIEKTLLWPGRWGIVALRKKYSDMLVEGMTGNKFAQEYLNTPLDDASRKFQWDWLQKTFTDEDIRLRTMNRYVAIDTADSKRGGSDYTFKVTVDWDSDNNWFVRSAKRKRVNSAELVDWIFDIWTMEKPNVIGVEKNAFKDQVEPWLKAKSEQTGVYPVVVELMDGGRSKEDRVCGALQGRFQAGKIMFMASASDDTPILRGELYDFPRGKHDDGCLVGSTEVITPFGKKELENIKIGDSVFTPLGFKKVIGFFDRGLRQVKSSGSLIGTPDHPVFCQRFGFARLDTVAYTEHICLTFKSQIRWMYRNLLGSMEKSIGLLGKENIICLNRQSIKNESVPRDCMWRFWNLLMEKRYEKALSFIIKTTILSTTTLIILSWLGCLNIVSPIQRKSGLTRRKKEGWWGFSKGSDRSPRIGTIAKREDCGIPPTQSAPGWLDKKLNAFASAVRCALSPFSRIPGIAAINASLGQDSGQGWTMKKESARFAQKILNQTDTIKSERVPKDAVLSFPIEREKVYDIEVEDAHCFYANGVLVGNCDALAYVQQVGSRPFSAKKEVKTDLQSEMDEYFKSKRKSVARRI